MAVEGLTPRTVYHYRIVAVNEEGEDAGVEKEFKTEEAPPSALTEPTSSVTRTKATLNGQVYPDGLATEYYFTYNEVGSVRNRPNTSTLPATNYGTRRARRSAG